MENAMDCFIINSENSDNDAEGDSEQTDLVQEHCHSHVSKLSIYW
jgi:hypothetical protein